MRSPLTEGQQIAKSGLVVLALLALAVASVIAFVVLTAGCSSVTNDPVPMSRLDPDSALVESAIWISSSPDHRVSRPVGFSMNPAIVEGDWLLLRRYRAGAPLEKGWIVGYTRPHDLKNIVHRVMDVNADQTHIYVSGDNNRYSEGWLPVTQVRWVVVKIIKLTEPTALPVVPNRG